MSFKNSNYNRPDSPVEGQFSDAEDEKLVFS